MQIGYLMPLMSDNNVVEVQLFDRAPELPDETMARIRGKYRGPEVVGVATVTLELDANDATVPTGRAVQVALSGVGGLATDALRRFPWRRVIASAVAAYRARHVNSLDAWQTSSAAQSVSSRSSRPPGRPSKSALEYQEVANLYRELVQQGERAPTTRIAERYHVERSTAASWVRRARQQGFLEAATSRRQG